MVDEKRELDTIDGIDALKEKVESLGMRYLFRYSGTENKIRLLLEGKDEDKLEEMMEECKVFFKGALA
jgi:phosphoglucosamine mutase